MRALSRRSLRLEAYWRVVPPVDKVEELTDERSEIATRQVLPAGAGSCAARRRRAPNVLARRERKLDEITWRAGVNTEKEIAI